LGDPNDPGLYEGLKEKAVALEKESGCAIIIRIPAGLVALAPAMRGFGEWLINL